MEAEKAVDTAPETNQAGDPFDAQTTASPELGIDEALKTLDALDEEEAAAEEEDKSLSLDELRAIVKATAQAVTDAEAVVSTAKEAYKAASKRAVGRQTEPTLAELNNAQSKHTATEQRHRRRAMKALGELGYGNQKPKTHPPLFKPS